jgi:hypothetical protein
LSIPEAIEFLKPWQIIQDTPEIQDRAGRLSARLESELPPKHILFGLKARAVAIRMDQDDVLFEIEGGDMPLAVVHMTWRKEANPRWPLTKLFESWGDWVQREMLPAHKEYDPA